MKIAFLCGGATPGRDGVGDYTRALAGELARTGHTCLILALHDPCVAEGTATTLLESGVRTLLCSSGKPWDERAEAAAVELTAFAPDWVSIQFVAYAFHPKGLPGRYAAHLCRLAAGRRVHLMLHELWIGESTQYGWKDRAVGRVQKWGVLRLIRALRPALVQTSQPAFVELLKRNGVSARELPLPGNIPICTPDQAWWKMVLREAGWAQETGAREEVWWGGVFGTIHPDWKPDGFFQRLCELAPTRQKRVLLLHGGVSPAAGRALWNRLESRFAGSMRFLTLGPLTPRQVSTFLQNLDFGVATNAWALTGKSGSIAAMLDHGLPVVVPDEDWRFRRGVTPEPTVHRRLFREDDFLATLQAGPLPRAKPAPRLPEIARDFLAGLARAA